MTNTGARLLIVEDEPAIALALEDDLTIEGYQVAVEHDGLAALKRARDEPFDAIVLDVMLPGKDGFEICRELRRRGLRVPILMLTARAQEAEKVLGLEVGADDYVTKPFGIRELRARIAALLRRSQPAPWPSSESGGGGSRSRQSGARASWRSRRWNFACCRYSSARGGS
jgi:DNA-binding response OmpR family regulator